MALKNHSIPVCHGDWWGGEDGAYRCPECSSMNSHFSGIGKTRDGDNYLHFWSECDHEWIVVIHDHKGSVYLQYYALNSEVEIRDALSLLGLQLRAQPPAL